MSKLEEDGLLSPYRVLDLSHGGFSICGKILGDLGADVIKVEPRCGDAVRYVGPFYKDELDINKSLFFWAYNTNKRGMTLDIETADGQEIFKKLLAKADFVIESYQPGYLDKLGLGYKALSKIKPSIIMASITPFGQTGPYAKYRGPDLITWALGGFMYFCGDPDRPPVWISFPHAAQHAGAEAAGGVMIANAYRERKGGGQHVDVSTQQCMAQLGQDTIQQWDIQKLEVKRNGYRTVSAKSTLLWGYRTKDGYVHLPLSGGSVPVLLHMDVEMTKLMKENNMCPEWLEKFDWVNDFDASKITQEEVGRVEEAWAAFIKTRTKSELYDEAIKRRIVLTPVSDAKDIAENIQLKARDFWEEVFHPELNDTITYCGPFVQLSESPIKIRRRPPLLGEHNQEIYTEELGFSTDELVSLKEFRII